MPTDKVLRAAIRSQLQVAGTFKATLRWEVVYVLHDLHKPLLGRGAIEALGLVTRICVINDGENFKQQYNDLFTGLGRCLRNVNYISKATARMYVRKAHHTTQA
jgi:hypothetical protein